MTDWLQSAAEECCYAKLAGAREGFAQVLLEQLSLEQPRETELHEQAQYLEHDVKDV